MTAPDLATLTGVRSGKRSYYRAYVRTDERPQAHRARDGLDLAGARAHLEGPRGLLEDVVRAAGDHLEATWSALVLLDGELGGARPRLLAVGPSGDAVDDETELPGDVRGEGERRPGGDPGAIGHR